MSIVAAFSGAIMGFIIHHLYTIEKICEECLIKEAMLEIKINVIDRLKVKKCDKCEEEKEANWILVTKLEDILDEKEEEPEELGWVGYIFT